MSKGFSKINHNLSISKMEKISKFPYEISYIFDRDFKGVRNTDKKRGSVHRPKFIGQYVDIHNHPSSVLFPSKADMVTSEMYLGIHFVITGPSGFTIYKYINSALIDMLYKRFNIFYYTLQITTTLTTLLLALPFRGFIPQTSRIIYDIGSLFIALSAPGLVGNKLTSLFENSLAKHLPIEKINFKWKDIRKAFHPTYNFPKLVTELSKDAFNTGSRGRSKFYY